MKEYLLVYIEYKDICDAQGYCINKIPNIKNKIVFANNKKDVYLENEYNYEILNIIDLESEVN